MNRKYDAVQSGTNCVAIGCADSTGSTGPYRSDEKSLNFVISYNGVLLTEKNPHYNPAYVIDINNCDLFRKFRCEKQLKLFNMKFCENCGSVALQNFISQKFIQLVDTYSLSCKKKFLKTMYSQDVSIANQRPSIFSTSLFQNKVVNAYTNFTSLNISDYVPHKNYQEMRRSLYQQIDEIDVKELLQEKRDLEYLQENRSWIYTYLYRTENTKRLELINHQIKTYYDKLEQVETLIGKMNELESCMINFIKDLKEYIVMCVKEEYPDKEIIEKHIDILFC